LGTAGEIPRDSDPGFALGEPPWYSYVTASSDCEVGKEIDIRELVYS